MFNGFNIQEIICFISVFLSVGMRMFVFSRIKKKTATMDGRDYIAEKGLKTVIALETGIILSAILFILVKTLGISLMATIVLQLLLWGLSLSLQRSYIK